MDDRAFNVVIQRVSMIGGIAPVIVIDGTMGAGKTTLGRGLVEALRTRSAVHLDLDDVLGERDRSKRYWELVDIETLRNWLANASGPRIVSGICALKVLERVPQKPDCLIYVRRVSIRGDWADAEEVARPPSRDRLRRDIAEYHAEFDPISRADLLYDVPD